MKSYLVFTVACLSVLPSFIKTEAPSLIKKESSQCPILRCAEDNRMDIMDQCFRVELQEPGVINLKQCEEG